MKKNFLLIVCLIIVTALHAQAPLNYQGVSLPGSDLIRNAKTITKSDVAKAAVDNGDRALTYYWLNYSDAVDYAFNGLALENLAALPLWPDSSGFVVTGTGEDFHWYGHGYFHMFDPISDFVSDYVDDNFTVIGDASDWFNDDHAFQIDSVRFYYFYDRPTTGYTDTLKVYLIAPNSTCYAEGFYFDNDGSGDFEEGSDISIVLSKYKASTNAPNGTFVEYTYLLGDADTASNSVGSKSIDIDYTIAKNSADHFIGIAFQFIPGQPYSLGDTLLDFSDPPLTVTNPLNRFYLLCNEEILESSPASWSEYSENHNGFASTEVRYDLSPGSWNGYYISTYAYTDAFAFEQGYVDWLMAPKGVNFLATTPSPCVSLSKNFQDLSNFAAVPDDATYYWEFGDGNISFERNPSHTYLIPGTYSVQLTVDYGGQAYDYSKNVSVDYCTAIEDIENLYAMGLFPNPADEVINISLTFGTPQGATISIVNMAGQVVNSFETGVVSNYNNAIDISSLPAGVYMARVSSGNQATVRNFVVE
jgi:PKD repeat protein